MLRKYVPNVVKVLSVFVYILRSVIRQKKYMKKSILYDVEGFKKDHDQSLTEKDFDKIKHYYGLAVPVVGEIYSGTLRGERITPSERKTLTYLGGTTGLFDDFFDNKDTPEDHIKELINNPGIENARNLNERLFIQFYLKALDHKHPNLIKEYSNIVFKAQIISKKQTSNKLSYEEILQITEQKGGVSILFYRAGLESDLSDAEKNLLFKIGSLGQLENDIFDIYKDYQEGIHTLPTTTKSITALSSCYKSMLYDVFKLIEQTDFPKRNKKKFTRVVAIIAARGLVCLEQLIKLEHDGTFEISEYSRKQLICDMGKLKNILKWVHLSVLEVA